ncbi:hypothetical protein SAPIO_CDS2547 [Scedosporium apiospermum]|uniref:Uncharacterized protein n=1 Tax=Pseudallescheria apiosperma TaxID=563466 RepID=A0A084GCQ2_PSEDA|nr:uncharacterized protein SAPIO_CDS2547 [Scedosporium apiospermum]KEZ45114.1 hypothetical protein SAPIO_CDS2547 [Scedosporium apiospermum]
MDWLQDNDILDVDTSGHVFKYQEGPTTLVRLSPVHTTPLVWHMHNKCDWDDWFETEHPGLKGSSSAPGLVLVLAKRAGEMTFPKIKRASSGVWLEKLDQAPSSPTEKSLVMSDPSKSGRRTMQILPFSKQLFGKIAREFYIHSSMARTVSRADVSSFSAADLVIKDQNGSAFPAFVEESIDELETRILELSSFSEQVESLSAQEQLARNEAKRSAWLDTTYLRNHLITWVAQLEKLSRCLDELSEHGSRRNTAERINIGGNIVLIESLGLEDRPLSRLTLSEKAFGSLKRTLFDTLPEKGIKGTQLQTHCSTDLSGVTKDTLLENRIKGTELQTHSSPDKSPNIPEDTLLEKEIKGTQIQAHCSTDLSDKSPDVPEDTPLDHKVVTTDSNTDLAQEQMKRIGKKIKARVLDVIDEYNDKIRDCTMRVDGMAMSTQWAQGETSVEIATATGRDSRHMRSIALVTMIFLPGTFFASVFSMTFFDWNGSGDGNIVSGYLWIYIVIVFIFTVVTLGCWWYFGVHRRLRRRKVEFA